MDTLTNEQVEERLKSLVGDISGRYPVTSLLLFGSRARGDNLLTSDVDALLVSPGFEDVNFHKRIRDVAVHWDEDLQLEPVCLTPRELEERRGEHGIIKRILEEGREIPIQG